MLATPLGGGEAGGGGGTGLIKYAAPTGGGLIDTTKTTPTTGIPIGATTTAPGREYDISGASDAVRANWDNIPNFANFGLLDAINSAGEFGSRYPGAGGVGRVGGQLYTWGGGSGWETSGSLPLKTTT